MSRGDGPVAARFVERITADEARRLSPLAVASYATRGRERPEQECGIRTPFQRDRDRIVHTKAFRRLRHKTQVFIAPEGDHYRTRLTHTLEVVGVARTVARALRLNEDLTEAVALGHDLGHPPFGHAGEEALSDALYAATGERFRHNHHSLRIVEQLENDGAGLNLTHEVRDGILNHTGDTLPATLEGRIVRIVDRVAYINHDIDDAIRAGVLDPATLPADHVALLGDSASHRIDALVHDLVETSDVNGNITQSEPFETAMLALRHFMFDHVYLRADGEDERRRVRHVITALFRYHLDHAEQQSAASNEPAATRVVDHVAGMTDRFALRRYRALFEPDSWRFAG
jgi:dGTPase